MREEIINFFDTHKTVLTTYGSMKTYKINKIDFDKNPTNTNISFKDAEGEEVTINLVNYYFRQYKIIIKDLNQGLLVADGKKQKNNSNIENKYIIYLVPELVYITGLEEVLSSHKRIRGINILSKTKMNPSNKISTINEIKKLFTNDQHKMVNKKNAKKQIFHILI
jgi:hypothetical protein